MSPTLDYDTIDQQLLPTFASLVQSWLPAGRMDGREYKIGGLHGKPGNSMSINLQTGVWKDFATGDLGPGPLSLYAAIHGIDKQEAARRLSDAPMPTHVPKPTTGKEKDVWTPLAFVPEGAPEPKSQHFKHGKPSRVWTYRDAQGRVIGHVYRFDLATGKKDVIPLTFCRNERGILDWRWQSFGKPRPLYGLDLLAAKPDVGVIIVEGEKAADAARTICPGIVITWPGGGKAVKHADWTPLRGRKVLIWPDQDLKRWTEDDELKHRIPLGSKVGDLWPDDKQPGNAAATDICKALAKIAQSTNIVRPPATDVDGWDLADAVDEGWDRDRLRAWLVQDKERRDAEVVPDSGPPPEEPPPTAEYDPADYPTRERETKDEPFVFLGHSHGTYYYLPNGSRQIVQLSPSGHTKLNLLTLAPMNWWEAEFPAKGGANWDAAANALIQRSHTRLFDTSDIRGRGAWIDEGRAVYHAGDRLIVDGREMAITALKSEKVYPQGYRLDVSNAEPATNREAHKLVDLCCSFKWRNPLDGKFLAGWLMIAPICGALEWRPHVWLNGPSGTGKTWLISKVISKVLGKTALYVNSVTTEAAIRQMLLCDALTVVFDEAESEDRNDAQRMKNILALARQASREGEGKIVKGSANGQSMEYNIRSSFFFSSIGVSAHQRADTSRTTSLELMRRDPKSEEYKTAWEAMIKIWKDSAAREDWCASIRSRSLRLATVIADNSRTFARACVEHMGQQRDADQIGSLLAGAYALTRETRISDDDAAKWCAEQDWSAFKPVDADADETRCLAHLLDANVRVDLPMGYAGELKLTNTTIGELVEMSRGFDQLAGKALLRMGIAVRDQFLEVSNSHQELAGIFEDTPWSRKWKDQLARLDGAKHISGARFGASIHRAVRIPLSSLT